jgi:hypothetical protein
LLSPPSPLAYSKGDRGHTQPPLSHCGAIGSPPNPLQARVYLIAEKEAAREAELAKTCAISGRPVEKDPHHMPLRRRLSSAPNRDLLNPYSAAHPKIFAPVDISGRSTNAIVPPKFPAVKASVDLRGVPNATGTPIGDDPAVDKWQPQQQKSPGRLVLATGAGPVRKHP